MTDILNAITLHLSEALPALNCQINAHDSTVVRAEKFEWLEISADDDVIAEIWCDPDHLRCESKLSMFVTGGTWLNQRRYDYNDRDLFIRIDDYVGVLSDRREQWRQSEARKIRDATGQR